MIHHPILSPLPPAPLEPTAQVPRTAGCAQCRFRHSALCAAMSREDSARAPAIHRRRIARDKTLFAQGDAPSRVCVLKSGLLRRERILADGRRSLLGLVLPGEIAGALVTGQAGYSLEAATDAEICTFDPARIRSAFDKDPHLRRTILQAAAGQYERQLEMIWQRGALTSRERIMAFLVTAVDMMPVEPLPDGSLIVTIELARRDWADLSNTTVETISRTLHQLTEKQMVRTVAPGRYWIRDLGLLADLAGLDRTNVRQPASTALRPGALPTPALRLSAVNARRTGKNRIVPVLETAVQLHEKREGTSGNIEETHRH